jgi:hypothetical protein
MASPALLGWIGTDGALERVETSLIDPAPKDLALVVVACSDYRLKGFLRAAAGGRVAKEILRPAGLYAVRYLAATLIDHDNQDAPDAVQALAAVLNAVWARIGSQPDQWLNSLALLGKRIAAVAYTTGDSRFYAADGEMFAAPPQMFAQPSPEPAPAGANASRPKAAGYRHDPNLQILVEADGAKTLAPKLLRDAGGLRVFLQKHGGAEVLEIMKNMLLRNMLDGKPIHSIKSWRFFEAAIAEEMHNSNVSAMGIRPGDVFGAHKWKANA